MQRIRCLISRRCTKTGQNQHVLHIQGLKNRRRNSFKLIHTPHLYRDKNDQTKSCLAKYQNQKPKKVFSLPYPGSRETLAHLDEQRSCKRISQRVQNQEACNTVLLHNLDCDLRAASTCLWTYCLMPTAF